MRGTAIQIAKQAAAELGLPVPTELTTSLDQTSVQMFALLNSAVNELALYYEWQFLLKTATITTVAGQAAYDYPADLGRVINQTVWSNSEARPVAGPVSPANWQRLTSGIVAGGPFSKYRIVGNKIEFLPVPGDNGIIFEYQYISNCAVQSYLDPNAYTSFITNDQDTPLFDYWLLVKLLKLKLWQAKGLDTTSLVNDFSRVMDAFTGQDHGAPVLSLSSRRPIPFLTTNNIPDGSWQT
jgi:hypothetical protein